MENWKSRTVVEYCLTVVSKPNNKFQAHRPGFSSSPRAFTNHLLECRTFSCTSSITFNGQLWIHGTSSILTLVIRIARTSTFFYQVGGINFVDEGRFRKVHSAHRPISAAFRRRRLAHIHACFSRRRHSVIRLHHNLGSSTPASR